MGTTTFSGPIKTGTVREGATANLGYAVLTQTGSTTHAAGTALVQDISFVLPANAQILDIIVDVTTAYNSATSATLTVGVSTGDATYADSVDAKTGGRVRPTFDATMAAALADIGTTTDVVATVTSDGDPSAGAVTVTLIYAQK